MATIWLLGPENIGVALGISLLSCVQAELHAFQVCRPPSWSFFFRFQPVWWYAFKEALRSRTIPVVVPYNETYRERIRGYFFRQRLSLDAKRLHPLAPSALICFVGDPFSCCSSSWSRSSAHQNINNLRTLPQVPVRPRALSMHRRCCPDHRSRILLYTLSDCRRDREAMVVGIPDVVYDVLIPALLRRTFDNNEPS